jgi:hypothetical protein
MARVVRVIWGGGEAEYFWCDDWTGQITLKQFQKIDFPRSRPVA